MIDIGTSIVLVLSEVATIISIISAVIAVKKGLMLYVCVCVAAVVVGTYVLLLCVRVANVVRLPLCALS